jgi:hypothetical protein
MSDAPDPRNETPAPSLGPASPVTTEDFKSVDFHAPIATTDRAECMVLCELYGRASRAAEAENNAAAVRVFDLLNSLCGLHFKPNDRASPYGPLSQFNGKRSAIPDDFRGAQCEVLREILPTIRHPGLRARIADIVWLNNRKAREAAEAAVTALVETVDALLDGTMKDQFDDMPAASIEKLSLLQRALQIAAATSKRGQFPDHLKQTAKRLYKLAFDTQACIPFERLARLLMQYELMEALTVAKDAEAVAAAAMEAPKPYPMAIKAAWDCAAYAYQTSGDTAAFRRCLLQGVDQTIAMRKEVSGAAAEAHWLRTAIAELRQIPGTNEQREALRREMRALQEKSIDELGSFHIPLDVGDMRSGTIEVFEGFTLPTALSQFALLSRSQPVEGLKREAIDGVKNSPLAAMMSGVHYDHDGKIRAETPGAPTTGEPDEEWFKKTIAQNLSLRRQIIVSGTIDAARQVVADAYPVTERHFLPITAQSPFVPATHRHTFALGFARFMQGDFLSAAHLLIPQLEHSVRYVLHSSSADSSKIMPDMLQEDRPLSALIDQLRPEMECIFSAPIVYEMDLLFTYRGGPALRHEFAHGKVADGYCFSSDVIYACWFIYHLTCLPLLPYWATHVAPILEAEAF